MEVNIKKNLKFVIYLEDEIDFSKIRDSLIKKAESKINLYAKAVGVKVVNIEHNIKYDGEYKNIANVVVEINSEDTLHRVEKADMEYMEKQYGLEEIN